MLTPSSIAAVRAIRLPDSSEGESDTSKSLDRLLSTLMEILSKALTHDSHDQIVKSLNTSSMVAEHLRDEMFQS